MNKTQILQGLASLLEEKTATFPREALLKELTTIQKSIKQAISIVENGKRTYRKHRKYFPKQSKYRTLADNCVAWILKANGASMRSLKGAFNFNDDQYAGVSYLLKHDNRVVVTKNAEGLTFYEVAKPQ